MVRTLVFRESEALKGSSQSIVLDSRAAREVIQNLDVTTLDRSNKLVYDRPTCVDCKSAFLDSSWSVSGWRRMNELGTY